MLGADWDTILCDYECSNLFYRSDLEEIELLLRGRGIEEEILPPLCGFAGVHAPMLENAWKYMDRKWGGALGYLTAGCGVSADEIAALREAYDLHMCVERFFSEEDEPHSKYIRT